MIKLYGISVSPYVRKVSLALKHKGLLYENVLAMPREIDRTISPLGKIPALEDNGLKIADSTVICDYLDTQYGNTKNIIPKEVKSRVKALWLNEYFNIKVFDNLVRGIFVERVLAKPRLNREPNEQAINDAIAVAPEIFDYIEGQLEGNFLVGNSFTIADASLVSMMINLMYADFGPKHTGHNKLNDYFNHHLSQNIVKECLSQDQEVMKSI